MRPISFFSLLSGLLFSTALFSAQACAEKVPFTRVINLALAHSGGMKSASDDDIRAYQGYLEARNAFVPQINFGSGLAYTLGFPLGAPSVFSVTSQSLLLNPAQRDFVKAAHNDWLGAKSAHQDKRRQLILDTALAYIQLDQALTWLTSAQQQNEAASQLQSIMKQRVEAGVESQLEMTRSRLNSARVKVRIAEIETNADVLRMKLAQLTGLPAATIETDSQSIPPMPPLSAEEDFSGTALEKNPAVEAANQQAIAKAFRATGERKQLRPAVDLVGEYALFSRFNNFDEFYRKFTRHNLAIGVNIRVPFLNLAQSARVRGAQTEAIKAKRDVQAVKDQISSETLHLQRIVQQLQAAEEVAQLDYELAKSDLDTLKIRIQSGTATVKDQGAAEAVTNDKYATLMDTTLELQKSHLQLMRTRGDIENWAIGQPK